MPQQPPVNQPSVSVTRDTVPADPLNSFNLPPWLAERYRILRHLPTQNTEVDLLVVESRVIPGQRAVAKLYRPGIHPKSEVVRQINTAAPRYTVRLLEYGQSGGIGYELLEYAEQGSLRAWMTQGPLAAAQTRELLMELSTALATLHEHNILHRNLKPENVLLRGRQPLQLALSDFGAASLVDLTLHLSMVDRTAQYGAPEIARKIIGTAVDYWALGMILVEALTGRHPFAGLSGMVILYQLLARSVPVGDIAEPWRTLCRGLLLRDPQQRWGHAEIQRWLAGDADLQAPAEVIQPEAKTFRPRRIYRLGGVECRTAQELATQMAAQWEAASKDLTRGFITDWLRQDLGDQDSVQAALDVLNAPDLNADERLLCLLLKLKPDLPPVWKHWSLEPATLVAAAQAANQGDETSQTLILELYQEEILGIYATAGNAECQRIQTAWQQAVTEYEQAWQTVLAYNTPTKLQPDFPVILPSLLLVAISPAFQDELQTDVLTLAHALAQRPAWLAGLLESPPRGSGGLVLRRVMQWLPLAVEIQQRATLHLDALLKEFAILHRCPDFNSALDQFGRSIHDGCFDSPQAVEQALSTVREEAQTLATVLRHYYALWEQIAVNSAACPMLQQWQTRVAAPRYADASSLQKDLTQPRRWRIVVEGWKPSPLAALTWEHEHFKLSTASTQAVAFSPDGQWLASGGRDRTLRLWRVQSRQCAATLPAHVGGVNSVAFSPDGQWLASGGGDRSVRLWRVAAGQCIAILPGHTGNVNAIAFSPDGQWLASGSGDRTVRLWWLESRQCVVTLSGHLGSVNAVAFSPDGQWLASGGGDRSVRLWQVDSGQCVATLSGRSGRMSAVAFSPDGRWLVTGSGGFSERRREDDVVRLWRLENRQCAATLLGHAGGVNAVAFSPDGRLLASGSRDQSVRLWRLENRQCVVTLLGQAGSVNAIVFSLDGQWLASACDNGLILWSQDQAAMTAMSLDELIAWEKQHTGQYSEIKLLQ